MVKVIEQGKSFTTFDTTNLHSHFHRLIASLDKLFLQILVYIFGGSERVGSPIYYFIGMS
jgi:hypothetical protein